MQKTFTVLSLIILNSAILFGQTWQERAEAPGIGRHHPVTFSLDGKGYMVAGTTDFTTATSDFYQYDPANDSWATLTDFPGVGRGFSISDTWDGKAYMGFGFGSNNDYLKDLWEFDPTTQTWTELASCPCAERIHPTFVIEDGLLFVGLGNNDVSGNLDDWWEYNISTDTWRQLPDIPGPPRHHPFMFSANGDVYTGLGHGNSPGTNIYDDWYKWDIQNEEWEQMNDFPGEARVAGTQFSIGDRGFVLSGDGDNHYTMAEGEFWEYDYQTDTWEELPPHPGVSRWAPGSFVIDEVVYFMAGEIRTANSGAGLQKDLWSFDLAAIANTLSDNQFSEITLYPNPARSLINLEGVTGSNTTIKIVNSAGITVLDQRLSNANIDVSLLQGGLYFISIEQGGIPSQRLKFTKL